AKSIVEIAFWALVAIAGTAIVWFGSGLLETASARLSAYYGLPEIVQGAVVVAIGSSFPELSAAVLSTALHGEFELAVAAIVGSALFNILVIPALSGLVSREQLRANRDLVYKEAQFYMIAVAVLTLTFAFAAIYHPVADGDGIIRGEMTRWLALMPLALYGLYLWVQYYDTIEHDGGVETEQVRPGREWLKLGASLLVILAGVEGLVRAAVSFGEIFDTPAFLWGMTVVAAGTSVPDAFVSVRAARGGRAVTSIANVLGSNTFDLLVCIPAGVLVAGTAVINFSIAAPLMGLLTVATIALFLMMRTRLVLSRRESWALLVIYLTFVAWMVAENFGAIDLVPSLPPD
ncbi:MAG: sodium:calcium antiporter, partial [Wenzhouxiangellaceae bacterium]|nr:sodium:calcium antiporter [Wenzhouxiangellaceae bacterium]